MTKERRHHLLLLKRWWADDATVQLVEFPVATGQRPVIDQHYRDLQIAFQAQGIAGLLAHAATLNLQFPSVLAGGEINPAI